MPISLLLTIASASIDASPLFLLSFVMVFYLVYMFDKQHLMISHGKRTFLSHQILDIVDDTNIAILSQSPTMYVLHCKEFRDVYDTRDTYDELHKLAIDRFFMQQMPEYIFQGLSSINDFILTYAVRMQLDFLSTY